jgi:HTH-type transcriptional regulator, sugar sensing transcriptional regulator
MLELLEKFGIPKKEGQIYLALLELGPSSVTEVAKRSKIPRTNAYHLLNSLIAKGLVNEVPKEGTSKMVFVAEDPARILQMLRNERDKFERLYNEAEELMPELQSVYNRSDKKLKVRFFEGVEGLISAYEDTLTASTEILAAASVEHQHTFFPGYFPAYYNRRTKKGISVRCILADSEGSRRIKEMDETHLRKTMIVPERFAISPELNVYDNKIALLSLKEKFGAIIESEEIADAFRKLFELCYERAEEYDKKLI